jgi:hypothetical protein
MAGLIGRQHPLVTDGHAQQVANGVGVLGAVQAMNRDAPGLEVFGGGLVQTALERSETSAAVSTSATSSVSSARPPVLSRSL